MPFKHGIKGHANNYLLKESEVSDERILSCYVTEKNGVTLHVCLPCSGTNYVIYL